MRPGQLLCLALLYPAAVLVQAKLDPLHFVAESVRSDIFKSVRPTGAPVVIKECGLVSTIFYGLLEQTYRRGETTQNTKCSWILRAPENYRINIIYTAFDLLDPTADDYSDHDESKSSSISFYDSEEPGKNLMNTFYVHQRERSGGYLQSISSNASMVVELTYRDHIDFATQRISVKYEFIDAKIMKELLQAHS